MAVKFKYPLVQLEWIDAQSGTAEWVDPEEMDTELPHVTTIGFLVKETEDAYIIASTITEDHINGQFKVPKGMTQSKKELSISTKKKKPPKVVADSLPAEPF